MRNHHSKVFKTFFHEKLFRRRTDLGLSQDEMANRLKWAAALMWIWITENPAAAH